GYLEPEFRLLDAPFEDRGARTDDAIRALRASFGRAEPQYTGTHFDFGGVVVDPFGVQQDVPIWVGGRSQRSRRRAVELGDGWCPFAVSPRRAAEWLARVSGTDAWQRRDRPLDVMLGTRRAVDPQGAPDEAAERVKEVRAAGATKVSLWF